MADKLPLKITDLGSGAGRIEEFGTTDTVPVAQGGTGAGTASAARTNLGLVKQTSSTDTTTGSIVIVEGALAASLSGFGAYYPAASGINIDTVPAGFCGLVALTAPNTGTFPVGASAGFIFLMSQRTYILDSAYQTAYDYNPTGSSEPKVWMRARSSTAPGTWGPWRRMYNEGNILGTVSQTGGVPTGAIIERGSNANGEYVRYADGTQICTFSSSVTATTSVVGSVHSDSAPTGGVWTTPAAFAATPSYGASASSASIWCSPTGTISPTQCGLAIISATALSGVVISVRRWAIGRWF